MAEPDKQYTGDGSDNYLQAAKKTVEAIKQIGQAGAEKAASAGAEAVSTAAASSVQAAAESGAASVAGTAAGAAVAGPVGAAIAAAWAFRHTLYKVLVTVCLVLLFIIIMVVSLPSIVANNIFHTDPNSVDASGLTDLTAIYDEMADVVAGCVTAAYDAAKTEVHRIITDGGYNYDLSNAATVDEGGVSAEYDICYILAAYSASMGQKGTTKEDLKNKLDAVADRMFAVSYTVSEKIVTRSSGEEGKPPVNVTLEYCVCTIHLFDSSVILTAFGIDPDAPYGEFKQRTGDVIDYMALALKRTLYGGAAGGQVPPITDAELAAYLNNLTCSPARKQIMSAALSLVGRVPYFWGGKSAAGWNEDWNTPKLVTATGDHTSGTLQPYGLDCSGFTDWVYKTALGAGLPGGSESQWYASTAITEADLLPGDLGFMEEPSPNSVNHELIYAGRDSGGNMLWVHCEGGSGVIMSSPSYVKYFRRVKGVDLDGAAATPANGG